MNKVKVLLHIPHTSLKVPRYFYKGLLISKEEFNRYNLIMSDVLIDEVFKHVKGKRIKAKCSRMFCDVEKFKDDNLEIMSKYGQGVIYTHTYNGVEFHKHDEKYKKKVYKYYDRYHKRIDRIASSVLKNKDTLLILDIHSFSSRCASFIKEEPFPDICIGVEEKYYSKEILEKIISRINELGLTYKINYPYSGSYVPNVIYSNKVKGNVISIMLEVNKKVYL